MNFNTENYKNNILDLLRPGGLLTDNQRKELVKKYASIVYYGLVLEKIIEHKNEYFDDIRTKYLLENPESNMARP